MDKTWVGMLFVAAGMFVAGFGLNGVVSKTADISSRVAAPSAIGVSACDGAVAAGMTAVCVNGNAYMRMPGTVTPLLLDGMTLLPCVCENGTVVIESSFRVVE